MGITVSFKLNEVVSKDIEIVPTTRKVWDEELEEMIVVPSSLSDVYHNGTWIGETFDGKTCHFQNKNINHEVCEYLDEIGVEYFRY